MKTKWMKLILVASLALNLAFVSTMLYREYRETTDRDKNKKKRYEQQQQQQKYDAGITFKTHFNLKEEQKEKIKKIIREFKMNLMRYKQDILDNRIAIIEALGETEFDTGAIETQTRQLNKLENELNLLFIDALIRIAALLEPGQRLDFLYEIGRNWFFIEKRHKPGPGEETSREGGTHD